MRRAPESKLVNTAVNFAPWSLPPSAFVPSKLIIVSSAEVSLGVLDLSWLGGLSLSAGQRDCGIAGSRKLIAGSLGRNELSIECGEEVNAMSVSEQRAVR